MDPDNIIREFGIRHSIPLIGVASISRWKTPLFDPWIPEDFFPEHIFPGTRSVIVIGLAVDLPVLETSPSIWYRELYKTINSQLDQYTMQMASLLNQAGYPSVFVPRDGYGSISVLLRNPVAFFSHRHAAVLAGLGTFGVNNMVLTRKYGPRIRFGSVFTTAEIPSSPLIDEDLCIHCNLCVDCCPTRALKDGDYPQTLTDKQSCATYSASLNTRFISPCGICIKVCPVGTDRIHFGRMDSGIYKTGTHDPTLIRSWEHVRRYGGKEE